MSEPTSSARLLAFIDALPPFASPAHIRQAARDHAEVSVAALDHLHEVWVREPSVAAARSAIPVIIATASEELLVAFARRILFRLPHPAAYRALIPQLVGAIDDRRLEELIIEALGDPDDLVVANALDLQYHAYGWTNRFTVSPEGAAGIAAAVATARSERARQEHLDSALARYKPPVSGPRT